MMVCEVKGGGGESGCMEHRKGREEAWRAASLGQDVHWVRDGMEHLLLSQLLKLPPDSAS